MAAAAIKKKWHGASGGHIFSLLLDIDGQSLRLRVLPSIDGFLLLIDRLPHFILCLGVYRSATFDAVS